VRGKGSNRGKGKKNNVVEGFSLEKTEEKNGGMKRIYLASERREKKRESCTVTRTPN